MDEIKEMEGKKVYLELVSNRKYSGTIILVDTETKMLKLNDKFGETIWIALSEIKLLQEERQ